MTAKNIRTLVAGLAASHGASLRHFLLARVRNGADVPDIIQEVYLRMLRIPNAESIRSPEAYLFTVARHVLQQHALRQSTAPLAVDLDGILDSNGPSTAGDPVLEMDAQQCLEQLQDALDLLSPKMRAVFMLHRRDGLSIGEIAERLEISTPLVKKYLMKALIQFRLRLEQDE